MRQRFQGLRIGDVVAATLAMLLAACGPEGGGPGGKAGDLRAGSAPVTTPDMRVDEVPTGEPGLDRKQWRALGEPAVGVLGNLTASVVGGRSGELVLAFAQGVTVRAERIADLRGQDRAGGDLGDFARLLGMAPGAGVFVYLVQNERRANIAPAGGMCRAARPTHLAISEFVDDANQWVLRIAAFRGETPPGPGAAGDPGLCAVYNYGVN
jgi:hypothetical protein